MDEPKKVPAILIEHDVDPDSGMVVVTPHSGSCARTIEAYEAATGTPSTRSGPAKVTSNAYRAGWDRLDRTAEPS